MKLIHSNNKIYSVSYKLSKKFNIDKSNKELRSQILLVDLENIPNKVGRYKDKSNINKYQLTVKDSTLDNRDVALFADYSLKKEDFIRMPIEKYLASNKLIGNKSILVNETVCRVNMRKDLIENTFI